MDESYRLASRGHSKAGAAYWCIVEFGLIKGAEGLRIFGAGIASSYSEPIFALESPSPHWLRAVFDRYESSGIPKGLIF